MSATVKLWLSVILAVLGTVALFLLVLPQKKREHLSPFFQWVHDVFNFKELFLEKILKILYTGATLYVIVDGFFSLFGVRMYGYYRATFGAGLLEMLLGPILIRILYEILMLSVLLVKNTMEINRKLPNVPHESQEPEYTYCTRCGTRYDKTQGGCPNCDK